jgi:cell division protein FtsL
MSNTVQKMLSGTLYVILAVVLVGAVILILPVYWKYVTMQDENTRMEQEYRALREEQQRMLKEVHDLESESLAVEKIAREKYNLCRENEQILIYK